MKNNFKIDFNIDNVTYNYDTDSISTIKLPHQLSSNIAQPEYGVISQTATIELIDKERTLFDLLNSSARKRKGNVAIYLNDVNILDMSIDNIDYSLNGSNVVVYLKDDLILLTNYTAKSFIMGEKVTLLNIVQNVFNETQKVIGNYQLNIDSTTNNILEKIVINYGYIQKGTLWDIWNKIAQCGILKIYIKNKMFYIRRIV